MAIIILGLFFLLQSMLLLGAAKQSDLIDALNVQYRQTNVKQLATGIDNYYLEKGFFPATLNALFTAPGYEYLKNISLPFQSMVVANNLNDTIFQYSRAAVFIQDPYDHPLTDTQYLSAANNSCGASDFSTGTDWCGMKNTQWWKHETRADIQLSLMKEQKRLHHLMDKFIDWYSGDISVQTQSGVWGNNFPNPGSSYGNLTALVAGFTQTATTCTGVYTWKGIPIDCSNLYSVWGTPTVYNYLSSGHIVLLTRTPYIKADGTTLYVSMEESL